jgi:GDP-D-mannose 3',5'-epimerase
MIASCERHWPGVRPKLRDELSRRPYHNIFGPEGTFDGGREKVPAAVCRKVARANEGESIIIWGDGEQTRSFLYIDECLEGTLRLMRSSFAGPLNIGSEEMISINALARLVMGIAGKRLELNHIPSPLGVRGRRSDNELIERMLGWKPSAPLREGLEPTYRWIENQLKWAKGGDVRFAAE